MSAYYTYILYWLIGSIPAKLEGLKIWTRYETFDQKVQLVETGSAVFLWFAFWLAVKSRSTVISWAHLQPSADGSGDPLLLPLGDIIVIYYIFVWANKDYTNYSLSKNSEARLSSILASLHWLLVNWFGDFFLWNLRPFLGSHQAVFQLSWHRLRVTWGPQPKLLWSSCSLSWGPRAMGLLLSGHARFEAVSLLPAFFELPVVWLLWRSFKWAALLHWVGHVTVSSVELTSNSISCKIYNSFLARSDSICSVSSTFLSFCCLLLCLRNF